MLAKKLIAHPLRPILEQLIQGIKYGISHLEEDRSSHPAITVMDVQTMNPSHLSDVLYDRQSYHGHTYKIKNAYTIHVAFRTPTHTRSTSYDCIFFRNGAEHGISFLPHEGLFDILGYTDE